MNNALLEIENYVATITLNRPDKSNAISRVLLNSFIEKLKEIHLNKDIRCAIIRGAGDKIFCAGADLEERAAMYEEDVFDFLDKFRYALALIESMAFPTVCFLNGSTFGGGVEIALATDIVLAKKGIQLGLTETKLGIIPGAGGTQRLARKIGISRAKDLIFRAARISADNAKEIGLVQELFDLEKSEILLKNYVEEIITSAPVAVKLAKQSINEGFNLNLDDALNLERIYYTRVINTTDRNEALKAFKEKRKPIFKGE